MITWVVALLLCLAMAAPVYAGDTFGVSGTEEWRFATGNAPSFIASGCLPVPVSGLTLGAFPCTAFVRLADGHQEAIIQPSSAFSLGAFGDGTYWLLLYRDTGTTVGGGWLRSAIGTTKATRYLAQKAVTRPAEVPGGIIFASLVVSGGNITTVNDLRTSLTMAMTGIDSPLDQMYGAKGDGVTDDYIPVQVAISSGRSLNFSNKTYKIGTKLLFLKSEATYRGEGATLLNVPTTTATGTRLADITGSDLLFDGVNFDGNALPVKGFLVYLGPNAARVKFHNLTIGNILSHEWGTNPKNFVVGLGISPYGVVDFEVVGVQFANIIKYNDGSTLIPASAAIVGIGNAHGIFFMNEDFSEPNAAQVTYTAGVIDNSVFDNIQTVLAAGLSENDRIEFDDGDGIRFYGCNSVSGCVGSPTRLAVKMTNLTFRKVSKRAIKMSGARGQIVDNITVYGAELPYGMVSIIKLDNDSFVSNVTAWAEVGKPYNTALQMQGNYNTQVRGVYIEFAINGVQVSAGLGGIPVSDMTFERIQCNSCSRIGFHVDNTAVGASTQQNIRLRDSSFNGAGAVNANALLVQAANDGTGGVSVDDTLFYNADLKFLGTNNAIRNSTIIISSTGYAGSTTSRALIEIGDLSTTFGSTLVNNLTIDATGINTSYLNATRDFLTFFGGNRIRLENFYLKVAEGLTTTYPHIAIVGADSVYHNITYHGPGSLHIGTTPLGNAAIRTSLTNVTRTGSTATTTELIYGDHANNSNIAIDGVYDLRATSASTVRLNGGTVNHTISNVSSATTNAKIVTHGNLAKTTNIQLFSANTFATLTAQEDGVVMWCRDCTKATPCAGSGTGAYAKRMNGAWDCD